MSSVRTDGVSVLACSGTSLYLWDLESESLVRCCEQLTAAQIYGCRFALPHCALYASRDRVVGLADLRTGQGVRTFPSDYGAPVYACDIFGNRAFTACGDGRIRTYDIRKHDSAMHLCTLEGQLASLVVCVARERVLSFSFSQAWQTLPVSFSHVQVDEVKILVGTMEGKLFRVDPAATSDGDADPMLLYTDPKKMPLYGLSAAGSLIVTGGGSGNIVAISFD